MGQQDISVIEQKYEELGKLIASFKAPKLDKGEKWVGTIILPDGITKHHKILLPEIYKGKGDHGKVTDWATSAGGEIPDRVEGAVLFNQLKDEFEPETYWLRETHASNDSWAWYQFFFNGYQGFVLKGNELRARAVRSELVI